MSLSRRQLLCTAAAAAIAPALPAAPVTHFDVFGGVPPGTRVIEIETFEQMLLRQMGASMGIPAEQLTQDWPTVSYSSARASLLQAWKDDNSTKARILQAITDPRVDSILLDFDPRGGVA